MIGWRKDPDLDRLQRERRAGGDRRSGRERRSDADGWDADERREFIERRQAERRVLRYGVMFSTERQISVIEDWLDHRCHGEWSIVLDGLDETLRKKRIRIHFELESDKDTFVLDFRR